MQAQKARWILQIFCWMLLYTVRCGVAFAEADNAWPIPLNASRDSLSNAINSGAVMKKMTAKIDTNGSALKLSDDAAGANERKNILGLQSVDMTFPGSIIVKRSSAHLLSDSTSGHLFSSMRPIAHAHLPMRTADADRLARKAIHLNALSKKAALLPSRALEVSQLPGSNE